MTKKMSVVQKMTLTAMLLVLTILGTRLPGFLQNGGPFSFNRITLGPALIIFSSLTLGPLYGAIVGAGADALGWVLMGTQTGTLNFYITILYGLLGILPWCIAKIAKVFRNHKGTPWTLYALLFIIWVVFFACLIGTDWFDSSFVKWGADPVACKYILSIVSAVLFAAMCVGLYFSNRYFIKKGVNYSNIASPYEVTFICLVSEIVLMVFVKPAAFAAYTATFIGKPIDQAWGISYSLLVLLSVMFSFIDLPINVFLVSWISMIASNITGVKGENKAVVEEAEEPKIDMDQLSEEDKEEMKFKVPKGWIIFFSLIILLMAICIIGIAIIGWPSASSSSSSISSIIS